MTSLRNGLQTSMTSSKTLIVSPNLFPLPTQLSLLFPLHQRFMVKNHSSWTMLEAGHPIPLLISLHSHQTHPKFPHIILKTLSILPSFNFFPTHRLLRNCPHLTPDNFSLLLLPPQMMKL